MSKKYDDRKATDLMYKLRALDMFPASQTVSDMNNELTRLRALVAELKAALGIAHKEALIHGNSYLAGITQSALDKE